MLLTQNHSNGITDHGFIHECIHLILFFTPLTKILVLLNKVLQYIDLVTLILTMKYI